MKKMILLALLTCLLCGCTRTSGPASTVTTVPAETEILDASQTTAPTEGPVELKAVNAHSFRTSKERPAVVVLDCRTAAFMTTEYRNKDYSKKWTRIQLVDLYTDTQKEELFLEGTYTPLLSCGAPGHLALMAPETLDVIVLDTQLQEVLRFRAEDAEGVLTGEFDRYYYTRGSQLYVQALNTGTTGPVSVEYDLTFHEVLDYDAEENILLVSAYSGTYTDNLCVAAVDLDTAQLLLLYQNVTGGRMSGQGILLEQENLEELNADVSYGTWSDGTLHTLPDFLVNNLHYAAWHVAGTDYVCRITYDEVQSTSIENVQLLRLGETVEVCSLQEELAGVKISQIYALPDGNLLALEVTGRGYRPYLICPELLEFADAGMEVDRGDPLVNQELLVQLTGVTEDILPEDLSQVRQKADVLEGKYGVTILLSNQCTPALEASGRTIITTDLAGLADEAGAIDQALDELDKVLGLYPEDFFRQFRNDGGERGLLVLLVEDFAGDRNVIGLSYGMGQWYPIAVDITSGQVGSTYCHEIWHATENRIHDLNKTALDLEAWANCNPADFQYSGNMTNSYIEDTKYTYFMGVPSDGVYFVDPYAKVNDHEDRARLMEYVMYSDLHARMMLQYPAMRAKLQLLCAAIRQTFDTDQWGSVHWERFF